MCGPRKVVQFQFVKKVIDAFRREEDVAKMSMLSNVQTYDIKNYENVKSFFEHIGLYLGLVAYTAAGAKVIGTLPQFSFISGFPASSAWGPGSDLSHRGIWPQARRWIPYVALSND